MLKVVGASWLQTRISTYILAAVILLGIGAIILGEYGHGNNDGTYSATISWKQKEGYRIDFWGQGNDLTVIPLGAARAYYKTGIHETGWSVIEIETSENYPDEIQAYAAGFLEGSLTWQLIHHHWYNTIRTTCLVRSSTCRKIRRYLEENSAAVRKRAKLLASEDPYWHMVRLFYEQLDGMVAGWRFAVRRSRRSVDIKTEDFHWLAMASDLVGMEQAVNDSARNNITSRGMLFLKSLPRKDMEPLIAVAHNTAAPYTRMLRLLKRYSFGYHVSANKDAKLVTGQSVVMTSYPGAVSSQDEYYMVHGNEWELIVTGMPLVINNRSLWTRLNPKDQVLSAPRTMAANRLAVNGRSWSRLLAHQNSRTSYRQWVTVEPRVNSIWLTEQLPGLTHAADYSKEFAESGFLLCTGTPILENAKRTSNLEQKSTVFKNTDIGNLQNITTLEHVRNLMRGYSHEEEIIIKNSDSTLNSNVDLQQILSYRGDLEREPKPVGILDNKILLAGLYGIEIFEATSGPVFSKNISPFDWSKSFPNVSHMGQPEIFNFDRFVPEWIWI